MADTAQVPASRGLILTVMCVGYFLVLLDVTIVNVALPQISEGLDAGVSGLQWVVDGYALALAALLLAGGTLGDLYGHKQVVLTGLTVFGVASAGCGLAPGTTVLITARIAQGVGAALLLPGSLAIVSRAFPGRGEQARAIGIWAGIGSVALPVGPVLGGALVSSFGWRAVFLVNVPIVAVAGTSAARLVRKGRRSPGRRLDWAGVALGGLFLASVTFAVIQAGYGGFDLPVVVIAVVAGATLVGFLVVERSVSDPMLPLHIFGRRPAFSAANAVAGAMNMGTLGLLFLLTLYLQIVQHRTALAAGVALLPLFVPLAVLAPLAGRITARMGPRVPMVAGLVLAAVGVALLAGLQPNSPYPELLPAMLLWGIGLGVLTPAVVAAAVGAVDPDRAGLASSVNNTARQAGGAIGIAVYGAVAGPATRSGQFIDGLHMTGLLTGALFLAATVASALFIPTTDRQGEG